MLSRAREAWASCAYGEHQVRIAQTFTFDLTGTLYKVRLRRVRSRLVVALNVVGDCAVGAVDYVADQNLFICDLDRRFAKVERERFLRS